MGMYLRNLVSSAKGVRQWDPLSPYIFIIMQDLLSRILNEEVDKGNIKGFKYRGLKINHLAFADDLLIIVKGNVGNCKKVQNVLSLYCKLIGQKINIKKSELFFPKDCSSSIIDDICNEFGIQEGHYPMKYLGAFIGPQKPDKNHQEIILSKALSEVEGWARKNVSQAGRMVLLNSVMNSIPIHTMATSWVSSSTVQKYQSIAKKYLWSHRNSNKGGLHASIWTYKGTFKRGIHYDSITQIHLSKKKGKDRWVWAMDNTGGLSCKSAYNSVKSKQDMNVEVKHDWKRVWNLKVIPKVKIFIWKLLWGRLPTTFHLAKHCNEILGEARERA
ncbi:reverse transcriptase [Canna indica]|uniref:Reverse transcriptase n=1 Tax=Canna indica TaxID=4628 RepID=A0AAQ3KTL5_9LILI|nr:reverse transcriptase [Canna indica]